MSLTFAFDTIVVVPFLHSITTKVLVMAINAFMTKK